MNLARHLPLVAIVALAGCGGPTDPGSPGSSGSPDASTRGSDAGPGDAGVGADAGQTGAACTGACTPCGTGGVCIGGVCTPSSCGDGCLDTSRGEQCDDGNNANLDGCDSSCQLEVEQRATSLQLQVPPHATDATCSANAVGAALVLAKAQTTVQGNIDSEVASGLATLGFAFIGLTDLTGAGDQTVQVGALYGSPWASRAGHTYDGSSDEDWWYATDTGSIDLSRNPRSALDGTLAGGALSASGSMTIKLSLGGTPTEMSLSGVGLHAQVGPASAPVQGDGTPGHIASEHLAPGLQVFGALTGGRLCANVSAASLANAALPSSLLSQGHCSESFGSNSTLLDLLVSGCTAYGLAQAIRPTQPDRSDPAAPVAGAGPSYALSASSGTHVNRCKDATGASVDLEACLASAAYSIYFQFVSDRVIFK